MQNLRGCKAHADRRIWPQLTQRLCDCGCLIWILEHSSVEQEPVAGHSPRVLTIYGVARNVVVRIPITTSLAVSTVHSGSGDWSDPQIAGWQDTVYACVPRNMWQISLEAGPNHPPKSSLARSPTTCFLHHISRKHPHRNPSYFIPSRPALQSALRYMHLLLPSSS